MLSVAAVSAAVLVVLLSILVARLYDQKHLKPKKVRARLLKQGIKGPKPWFLLGNIPEMRSFHSKTEASKTSSKPGHVSHEWPHSLFPFLKKWFHQCGTEGVLTFSIGDVIVLFVEDHELVKEISHCSSLNLGKASFLRNEMGALLGQGLLSSNGPLWAYQRKIISPELYMNKIKGMYEIMIDSVNTLVNCWENKLIHGGGDVGDIRIDLDMRNFSADVISKACFGSSYNEGREIFEKLRALQQVTFGNSMFIGLPGMKYVPVKSNREMWRLEKEVRNLILKVVESRKKGGKHVRDLLQIIIEGAENSDMCEEAKARFIVDNCKTIYFAGHESTAMTACWTLLLLASSPEWQTRVREEVVEICGGRDPDIDMVNKMKLLKMVINESLRLYPTIVFTSRETLEDMQFEKLLVPKGVSIWVPVVTLHRDTSIWGPDADEFKPERFSNGVAGACKVPQLYQPFGAGPRICAGLNLATVELKIVLSMLITKFSFSVPSTYKHSPVFNLVMEPENGINLMMKRI